MKALSVFCMFLFISILAAVPAGAANPAVDSAGNSYYIFHLGSPSYGYSVAKISPLGELIFEHPLNLPSRPSSYPQHIAVDPAGSIYIAGHANFDIYSGSEADQAFVAKLTPDGTGVIYESFLGKGSRSLDLAVDAQGQAYILCELNHQPGSYYVRQVARYTPSGSVATWVGGRTDYVTSMALGLSGDLLTLGWASDYFGNPYRWVILERIDASSGAVINETLIGAAGTVDWYVDGAATPGDGFVVAWVSSGRLHVIELGPAGEKIFSRVLNVGEAWLQDVAVTSSGEIVVTYSVASRNHVLRLEGGTGKILFSSVDLPPDCSGATASPSVLGPANGKMVLVSIRDVADVPGDRLTIALTSVFQDEGLTSPGTPDATGLGTSSTLLRAARLSYGNGRVYHLRFTATDSQGKACTGTVKVCVPVLQGGTCVDGGARVDSTRSY